MNLEGPMTRREVAPEKMTFPWGEQALEIYKKEYKDNPEEVEKLKEIIDIFFESEIKNIALYKSKEGATLPYTRINVGDLAKTLYEKQTGKKAEIKSLSEDTETTTEPKTIKREFVFPGAPLSQMDNGPFHFVEEAMHQCMMHLPLALEALKNGKEPETYEVVTLGTPVNQFGSMTPQFFEALKKDPTREMSKVYSEFIRENAVTKDNPTDRVNIELYGLSWGGGLAALTGEKLLETKKVSQSYGSSDEERLPHVTIKAQVPVSLSGSKIKKFQIPAGFVADGISSTIADPNKYGLILGKEVPKFDTQLVAALEKRGIRKNSSPEQQDMKSKSILKIIFALGKGLELKPETKITEIYGLRDATTYTPSLTTEALGQKVLYEGSLGQNMVSSQREKSRTFAVDTFHMPPWFREGELNRMKKAAIAMIDLSTQN